MAQNPFTRRVLPWEEPLSQIKEMPVGPIQGMPVYNSPASPPEPRNIIDEFYDVASNPPVRKRPSALRMIGTGLLSALQGSTGKESMQPTYNEAGRVVGSREAGFWESLGNKPFDTDQAKNILDMPHEANVEDWKTKAEAMHRGATIESQLERNKSLDAQRYANTAAIPQRVVQGQQKVNIAQQEADRKDYLASLNTLTDEQKIGLLQSGKIELQDLRDAASMGRVVVQQTGATDRTTATIAGAKERNAAVIAGALQRTREQQTGANTRNAAIIAGAENRNTDSIIAAGQRNDASIAGRSNVSTQQKEALLIRATQLINEHPEWEDLIQVDPNTDMLRITPPNDPWLGEPDFTTYDIIYKALYGKSRPGSVSTPVASPVASSVVSPVAPVVPPRQPAAPSNNSQFSVMAAGDEDRVEVIDNASGRVIGTIPRSDVSKLDKTKYGVVR